MRSLCSTRNAPGHAKLAVAGAAVVVGARVALAGERAARARRPCPPVNVFSPS